MPELPEVETIARGLRETLVGRRIRKVCVREPRCVGNDTGFCVSLAGQSVAGIRRRGKLLLVDLAGGGTLAVHLRMTGRFYLPDPDAGPDKHTHVIFELEPLAPAPDTPDRPDGPDCPAGLNGLNGLNRVFFHDVRKFGSCCLFPDEAALQEMPFLASLGPEPLELDQAGFIRLFQGKKARIKALLLDQKTIAGIGNIYADESLFRAGIRPDARAADLDAERLAGLHKALQEVLREAIADCGSSFSDYRDARGNAGAFQNRFQVYGRGGQNCLRCGRALATAKVAGRTSVFCPRCQKS